MKLGAIMLALAALSAAAEPAPVIDPRTAGAQLPPEGRSLFDFLVAEDGRYSVPFPFEALLARIAGRCGSRHRDGCLDAVLIPAGRSLQRAAAAPEFFRYPRVVVAVDGDPSPREGHAAMFLKDRLYLGYHEKAAVIEVISYNEAAGRFEFQVVHDYRAGATPRVVYANRVVCTACHQNHGPIFPRAAWDETNANPKIAALLGRKAMYGVATERGIDIPNAIDDATDRATFLPAYQRLWREGCDGHGVPALCRAALFKAALQYRLTEGRGFDDGESFQRDFAAPFVAQWRGRWPQGLAIAGADIPNRDPLAAVPRGHVAAPFDPLEPRAAIETWAAGGRDEQRRLVAGLAGFLAESDVRALDAALSRSAGAASRRRTFEAPCVITQASPTDIEFTCTGAGPAPPTLRVRGHVRGSAGEIHDLVLGGERNFGDVELEGRVDRAAPEGNARFRVSRRGRPVRLRDGNAIESMGLRWRGNTGVAIVTALDDFTTVEQAIADVERQTTRGELDAFSAKPFRRAAVMEALFTRLGIKDRRWCCLDAKGLPAPLADGASPDSVAAVDAPAALKPLYQFCANCHLGPDRTPPNFLQGDARRVEANVRQCAERLYLRLGMWQLPTEAREKSPMPPASALAALNTHAADWAGSPELAALMRIVAAELRPQGGVDSLEALSARGYENLRPCLATP